MWIAVITLTGLALAAGALLGFAARGNRPRPLTLADRVDALLPQTQCAQCGYAGCRPYAEAVAAGEAAINLCPPGGETTVRELARLLGRDVLPLDAAAPPAGTVAVIDESRCIGCTHCRNVCPVDAIVGAHQWMHTVISAECTGCELCIAPCPVDCISLVRPA